MMDLFAASFPKADWPKILLLELQDTAKARTFRALRFGTWVPGEQLVEAGCGWDFRTRVARLRDLKIPVESRPSPAGKACDEYQIDPTFLMVYEETKREQGRKSA